MTRKLQQIFDDKCILDIKIHSVSFIVNLLINIRRKLPSINLINYWKNMVPYCHLLLEDLLYSDYLLLKCHLFNQHWKRIVNIIEKYIFLKFVQFLRFMSLKLLRLAAGNKQCSFSYLMQEGCFQLISSFLTIKIFCEHCKAAAKDFKLLST